MFKLIPELQARVDEALRKKYHLPIRKKRIPSVNKFIRKYSKRITNKTPVPSASGTLEYKTWTNMKLRCYDSRAGGYEYYGGKGIKVCNRWLKNFQAFVNDMGPRPSIDYSIDRIDSDKDYEPSNCRWLLKSLNSGRHKRKGL
jgi:hypothetical protein